MVKSGDDSGGRGMRPDNIPSIVEARAFLVSCRPHTVVVAGIVWQTEENTLWPEVSNPLKQCVRIDRRDHEQASPTLEAASPLMIKVASTV